jgi:F-box protein 9
MYFQIQDDSMGQHPRFIPPCPSLLAPPRRTSARPSPLSPQVVLSPIQKLLPDEMLLLIFSKLPIGSLGAAQCVCQQWRAVGAAPSLWLSACQEAFPDVDSSEGAAQMRDKYRGSWKAMYLGRPHLRFDGVYVSRNTYLRAGITEWRVTNPVHLVAYYRYCRFLPDGTLLYRTSPENLAKVAKSLAAVPRCAFSQEQQDSHAIGSGQADQASGSNNAPSSSSSSRSRKSGIAIQQQQQQPQALVGRYRLEGDRVLAAWRYTNSAATEIRARMRLRSTVPGANNRLDVDSIVSWDRAGGAAVPLLEAAAPEDGMDGAEERDHRRGLATHIFVPWEAVATSFINLPPSQMDFFLPG